MKISLKNQLSKSFLKLLLAPLIIDIIIELCSRRSIVDTLNYIINTPLVFLYNSLIIFATLSIVLLFNRRRLVFSLITSIWIGFGVTNGIILSNRVTPFTATDLTLAKFGLGIVTKYLSPFATTLIIIGIIALLGFFVYLFFKGPKISHKINYKKNILCVASIWIFLFVATETAINFNVVASYFGNIAFAYLDYGFPYCFSNTLFNTGINKPSDYSPEAIAKISSLINTANNDYDNDNILLASTNDSLTMDDSTPNIIMLQLESFFDPTLVKYLSFSEDPIPNFRRIKDNYPSGYLTVPSVGAGTANTEFEVISGMSLKFFGPGEYPYKTILQESTCESINYDLKDLGYSTHAIHNNAGTFYDRDFVFSQLGFDTFTSLEYMNVDEYTPLGWAKDHYLINEIMNSLNSTSTNDFIYTISVQGHGDYPEESILENPKITLTGEENEGKLNALTYYVNQLNEMDNFIGELVNELSKYNEKVVLVMYGDHLPTLGFEDEDLKNNSIFQTEYVMWSNFDINRNDKDLSAYQLTSSVLESLNIDSGVLTKFHKSYKDSADYLKDLKLLQYDMLYGEKYIYNGENPFVATNIQMGVNEIKITNIYEVEGQTYIEGTNFTNFSSVAVNKENIKTTYVNPNLLMLENTTLEPSSSVVINQRTKGGTKLSSSLEYIYN